MSSDPRRQKSGPLAGVARDATSILEVIAAFEQHGFTGQFAVRDGGSIECFTCHHLFDAASAEVHEFRRLEGASDPDDELAIAAIRCPQCQASGTLVLNYGPSASAADQLVYQELGPVPPPPSGVGEP
jgi:hypothetical protein